MNAKKYALFLTALCFLYSCEYELLPTYSGQDQIFFRYADEGMAINRVDSTVIKFGYDPEMKTDSTIRIGVQVMGAVTDFDRRVNFIMVDSSSTAKPGDVELLHDRSMLPEGTNIVYISIKLHNTDALNDTMLLASIKLVENEFFKADYEISSRFSATEREQKNAVRFRVWFDNSSDVPNMWFTYARRFNSFFGPYSRVKFDFMCQVIPGASREYFTYLPDEDPGTAWRERFPMSLMGAWARRLNTALAEYEREHGAPLLDENGNEVRGSTTYI
jgi:hypothetical protein